MLATLCAALVHAFAQPFQCFPTVAGDVGVFGIGQAVEVGPQEDKPFIGHHMQSFVNALRILAGQRLPEPLQCLSFTQSPQGSTRRY